MGLPPTVSPAFKWQNNVINYNRFTVCFVTLYSQPEFTELPVNFQTTPVYSCKYNKGLSISQSYFNCKLLNDAMLATTVVSIQILYTLFF